MGSSLASSLLDGAREELLCDEEGTEEDSLEEDEEGSSLEEGITLDSLEVDDSALEDSVLAGGFDPQEANKASKAKQSSD